jgi:predicted RNase H-like HicB family nuclease
MSKCTFIIEDVGPNLCAYVPDLPGCVLARYTIEELTANVQRRLSCISHR